MTPAIFGLEGARLSERERAFFRDADPAGFILFGRNCLDPQQLRALTDDLRALAGRDTLPILIDQEGGRVARLGPPHWPAFPAAAVFDRLYDAAPATAMAAARANAEAIGLTLAAMGITVTCAPMLEVRQDGAHDIIGDRAYGGDPMRVAALGRAVMAGLRAGGVAAVIKHLPGYGRARADAHHALPVIDATEEEMAQDIAPFRALSGAPMGMTAHAIFACWDRECCATQSAAIIRRIIRDRIGFDGLLMTDAIEMQALTGSMAERACAALEAGCDVVLHGTGQLDEAEAIAAATGSLSTAAAERLHRAVAWADAMPGGDLSEAVARRDALLAAAA